MKYLRKLLKVFNSLPPTFSKDENIISANINSVTKVSLVEEYTPLNNKQWLLTKSKLIANFNITSKKAMGFIGRKETRFPLLKILPGNERYYYNKHAFNLMNRYEFISDEYAGFNIEHDLGSGIFSYIPVVRNWKLRQFWTAKGIIGNLSQANKNLNLYNGYPFRTLGGKPYIEIGTGVENIFHLIRIDFIWRVTPMALPKGYSDKRFGVFGSIRLRF